MHTRHCILPNNRYQCHKTHRNIHGFRTILEVHSQVEEINAPRANFVDIRNQFFVGHFIWDVLDHDRGSRVKALLDLANVQLIVLWRSPRRSRICRGIYTVGGGCVWIVGQGRRCMRWIRIGNCLGGSTVIIARGRWKRRPLLWQDAWRPPRDPGAC